MHAPQPALAVEPVYMTPRLRRWKNHADPWLLIAALGSIPFLVLEIDKASLPASERLLIDIVNIVLFGVFFIDYVVGLVLTDRRRAYVRGEWLNLLIVIGSAGAVFPDLRAFGSSRGLRALRPLRAGVVIVRALGTGGLAARDGRDAIRRNAFRFACGVAAMTWLTSAAAFTVAENAGGEQRVESFWDGLWWSAATITTVGYGDISPVTFTARVVGLITMVVGISTFAIITARVASFLVVDD